MDHLLEADTLPSAQPWHATYPLPEEAGNDEARIQSLRAPTEIAVHRLPMEIWMAVCEALRRLDLIDITMLQGARRKVYRELQRTSTNKNRPDPIITAVSILPLSQTCRYLHKVTSPSLLETIRLRPPTYGNNESRYRSVIKKVRSLQLNSNQRLRHVRGFAVVLLEFLKGQDTDHGSNLRNQLCRLLMRFPNLRHLTFINMTLDAPLMRNILTLPLEHLWLWNMDPKNPIADDTFIPTTTPKIGLRSLVLWEDPTHVEPLIPINWISQLIGATLQDLSIDASGLVAPSLPVLPDLEFLEVPDTIRMDQVNPSIFLGALSKMPNLKEVALEGPAPQGDPVNAIPALAHLECVVGHVSWLGFLIPGRSVTTAKLLYDTQVRMQQVFEILHKGGVPLRDLTLTYPTKWGQLTWSPEDLEHVARYLPELEILRLKIKDPKVHGLQEALFYISQLEKLRIVSFSFWTQHNGFGDSGLLDDVWQESKLREFIGSTKSPVLERVGFGDEFEWKWEATGIWILWRGGKVVRSVSL